MKNDIIVSIIIPYFRKKFFFQKTIKSIINQSFKKYEIILIYDDYDLQELDFVKKVLTKVKKKKILINKKNLGAGISRNKGILASKGKFIAFCDADDIWKKNKLSLQLSFMKKNNLNFSHTSYSIINQDSKIVGKFIIKKKIDYQNLLASCDIGLSTVIISKKILKNDYFSNLKTKEDFQLWLKIIKKIYFIYGLKDDLSSWRVMKNSLSSSITQRITDSFRLYYKYEKFNFFISCFYVIRLTFFALLKKIKMYSISG
jgi:teichuronic acid biosynthesis glycosyltransferase TuaG